VPSCCPHPHCTPFLPYEQWLVKHDMGMGNAMCIQKWVCSDMGTVTGLTYPGNTVPFSTVLQVFAGMPVLAFWLGE
jgi:hypothetical protein